MRALGINRATELISLSLSLITFVMLSDVKPYNLTFLSLFRLVVSLLVCLVCLHYINICYSVV